jgi:hypothetical protein
MTTVFANSSLDFKCSLQIGEYCQKNFLTPLTWLEVYNTTMKVLQVALSMFYAAGFIQTALGLDCSSGCSACWKDNDPNGVDIKILCQLNKSNNKWECGGPCPAGYSNQHCAESKRCRWVDVATDIIWINKMFSTTKLLVAIMVHVTNLVLVNVESRLRATRNGALHADRSAHFSVQRMSPR